MHSASTVESLQTDVWVKANWETFVALNDDPQYETGRFYYDRNHLRIEMAALGPAHGRDNTTVSNVVTLFATLNSIRIAGYTNTSFWKPGVRASQPDIAFYIGADCQFPPRSNSAVDVDIYGAPTLAIEIGATSFKDDLGSKRLLYEHLGIQEYWVVDVGASEVIAFEMNQGRSGRIAQSSALPGLQILLVEEALKRSQREDDGTINRWLIETFGNSPNS